MCALWPLACCALCAEYGCTHKSKLLLLYMYAYAYCCLLCAVLAELPRPLKSYIS